MATNPNAIFGEALATGPRQIPLSELQQQIAGTRQTQAQTADIGAQTAQRQQAVQSQAIQLQLEQQRRDIAKKHVQMWPSTPVPATFPSPGTDAQGNPNTPGPEWHGPAAQASNPVPTFDWNGYGAELASVGDNVGAESAFKTGQELYRKNLDDAKTLHANLMQDNSDATTVLQGIRDADPAQREAAYQTNRGQLQQLVHGRILPDHWDDATMDAVYKGLGGRNNDLARQKTILDQNETQATTAWKQAQAKLVTEQAAQATASRQAMEDFVANPAAELGRIQKLGLPPKATVNLINQVQDIMAGPGTAEDKVKDVNKAKQDAIDAQRRLEQATIEKGIPTVATQQQAGEFAQRRSDQSYTRASAQLEKVAQPVRTLQTKLTALQDTLDQNSPAADAAVGAQLIGIINGGQGGRMNAAMAERLVGGRSAWQGLLAAAQHWSPDPNAANSITANQRQQIRALASAFQDRVTAKGKIVDDARTALDTTDDVGQHRRIVTKAQNDLEAADRPTGTPTTTPTGLPQGNGRVIDRATAQQFYQAAGNDPAKARQLATANGWKVQ